ncbi:MAG: UDP-N-acetylmuramate dehydrogenase [Alphaproteobacteria bacterium]|nr:UDP-N-acetylmuramate dehydrogenase [Alphaproteobacteria bacterium]
MALLSAHRQGTYRGKFTKDFPLGEKSWFRCGGKADLLFEPEDIEDLSVFLKEYPAGDPLMVLGGMANCIIRDGGIRGCVVRLGKPFAEIEIQGNRIMAGAGALNGSVAAAAAKEGIGGLEFLSGIPGTVGGALAMNAGAYGTEVKDVLAAAMALDDFGVFVPLELEDMDMSYRTCGAASRGITFVGAVFEGKEEDREIVRERLKEIKAKRQETQPISEKTGGSTFANPTDTELEKAGLEKGTRAWQLVEKVGGRGLKIGGAQMSEKHCNFMINTGDATAKDLEELGDELIRRVREECGIELHWEIKRLGER